MDKFITALVSTFFAWIACFALAGVVCWIYGSSHLEGFPALLAIAVWWLPPVFVFLKTSGIWDSIASERARQKYAVEERKRNEENRKAEIERAKQQEIWQAEQTKQRLAAQQLAIHNTLASLASDSVHLAANLPSLAREAEQRLDLAEHEFKEGVFPTFWDAVEGAANKLATFNNDIQCIVANRSPAQTTGAHIQWFSTAISYRRGYTPGCYSHRRPNETHRSAGPKESRLCKDLRDASHQSVARQRLFVAGPSDFGPFSKHPSLNPRLGRLTYAKPV